MSKRYNEQFLFRMAQADAYAADYTRERYDQQQHKTDMAAALAFNGYGNYSSRSYTDVTESMVSMCELLKEDNIHITNDRCIAAIIKEHASNARYGHEEEYVRVLERGTTVDKFKFQATNLKSTMTAIKRAAAFGVMSDPSKVIEATVTSSLLTEQSWSSINAAISVALMMHFSIYQCSFMTMHDWIVKRHPAHKVFADPWHGPVNDRPIDHRKMNKQMNVACVVSHLVTRQRTLMGILSDAIMFGGETRTVAALSWAIASHRYKDEKLPEFFDRDFIRSDRDRLVQLGKDLMYINHPLRKFNLKGKFKNENR